MAATNTTNVQAIITNLETIVGTTLGFKLEYNCKDDPDVDTTPGAVILYLGETFVENFGEKPLYNEISFLILIKFTEENPGSIRDKAITHVHKLREGITIDALNVGDLSASKIVSWVDHEGAEVDNEQPVNQIDYHLSVRYREL